MHGACFVVLLFFLYAWQVADAGGKKQGNFEVVMDAINDCIDPNPAFTKKRLVTTYFDIHKLKGATVVSGGWSIKTDVPFKNFTISTFTKDGSGRRVLLFRLEKLTCRSLIAQTFLIGGNLRFDRNKCLLLKGSITFKDVDVNKLSHSTPHWHPEGSLIHQLQLVHRSETIFCFEVLVTVKLVA